MAEDKKKRAKYNVKNWPAYNQALRQHGSITIWLDEEAIRQWYSEDKGKRGRPCVYSDLAIETVLERCQCRKARAQRNHIACANLAWVILKRAAYALKTTVCQLKEKLLSDYVTQALNNPLTLVTLITRAA